MPNQVSPVNVTTATTRHSWFRFWLVPAGLLITFALVHDTTAAEPQATWASTLSVDMRIRLEQRTQLPPEQRSRPFPVIARLKSALTDTVQAEFEAMGIRFETRETRIVRTGLFYGLIVTDDSLKLLSSHPAIDQILPPIPRMVFPFIPTNGIIKVHELTTTLPTWGLKDARGNNIDGTGVTILDIDSGIDVYHPLFFRADGGFYAWIDTDNNGRLTAAIDAVDLNHNGQVDPGEVLFMFGGSIVDLYSGNIQAEHPPVVVAGSNFVFADTNGNGKRDHGKAKGFNDSTPGFGEPMFVADNVNGNAIVEVGEKLIMLGSSKIAGIYSIGNGKTYERGVNLTEFIVAPNALHGTGVAGILVGGVLGHTDLVGVAPGAELLMLDGSSVGANPNFDWSGSVLAGIDWAKERGAKVFVHEYGSQFGDFADGSTEWELLVDTLHDEGLIQTAATHNFAGLKGHRDLAIPALSTETFGLQSDDFSSFGTKSYYLFMTCRWTQGNPEDIEMRLTHPDQAEAQLWPKSDNKGWEIAIEGGLSPIQTAMLSVIVRRTNAPNSFVPFPEGTWKLSVKNLTELPLEIRCNVTDETGYSAAIRWAEGSTDLGTIATPGTATKAIAVGASVGNLAASNEKTEGLRYYSGRGPRIDGELGIDIVSPSDHFTAAVGNTTHGYGNYARFDGTSGALPLVSGAIALLLQAEPELTTDEVTTRLQQAAKSDTLTGETPNPEWGYGRLWVYRLLTGNDPPENTAPKATLSVTSPAYLGQTIDLDATKSNDPDPGSLPLRFRWDVGYDGAWDAHDPATAKLTVPIRSLDPFWVKLEVEDQHGARAYALAQVIPESAPKPPDPDVVSTPDVVTDVDTTSVDGTLLPSEDSAIATDTGSQTGDAQDTPPKTKDSGCSTTHGDSQTSLPLWWWPIILFVAHLLATQQRGRPHYNKR